MQQELHPTPPSPPEPPKLAANLSRFRLTDEDDEVYGVFSIYKIAQDYVKVTIEHER